MSQYKGVSFIPLWIHGGSPVSKTENIEPTENTANAETAIFRIQVPRHRRYYLMESPYFMKLYTKDGNELPEETIVRAHFVGQGSSPEDVLIGTIPYALHRRFSWDFQWGKGLEEKRTAHWPSLALALMPASSMPSLRNRLTILGEGLRCFIVQPEEIVEFQVKAPGVIDWSNANTRVHLWVHEELWE